MFLANDLPDTFHFNCTMGNSNIYPDYGETQVHSL